MAIGKDPGKGNGTTPRSSERSGVSRSEAERSGEKRGVARPDRPDPEVPAKAKRRRFSAKYKLRIVEEIERAEPGQVGAILRREGLYSSHLTKWRKEAKTGKLKGLSPKRRGRKRKEVNPLTNRVTQLERELARLQRKLGQAETIIEVQKKVSTLLGASLDEPPSEGQS